MWRFFSSLCILSIVAFLGLQRGQAGPMPERPQWKSAADGMNPMRGALGACSPPNADPAGRASAIPPPAAWAPPAEIASELSAGGNRSAVGRGALVWQPPAEIASAPFVAAVVIFGPSLAPFSRWAPPAEIASEPPTVEHRSAAEDGALIWRAPAEIASSMTVADPVSSIPPSAHWALPAEIAAGVRRHEGAVRKSALVWTPPLEIASVRPPSGRRADQIGRRV